MSKKEREICDVNLRVVKMVLYYYRQRLHYSSASLLSRTINMSCSVELILEN